MLKGGGKFGGAYKRSSGKKGRKPFLESEKNQRKESGEEEL